MSTILNTNIQARVPYEVRTPRFSDFPTLEPFDPNAYRSMAAYNKMLEAKKRKPEVPLQTRIPESSNFPTGEPFFRNAYRSIATYEKMLKTKKECNDVSRFVQLTRVKALFSNEILIEQN